MEIKASAANVSEALAALWDAYPGLRDRVLTEQGEVRHDGLAAVVKNGTVITIVPAVSGG